MFYLHFCFTRFYSYFLAFFLITSFYLQANENFQNNTSQINFYEHEWLNLFFENHTETFSCDETLDFLIAMRTHLIEKGCKVPSLSELCLKLHNYLSITGIVISNEEILDFFHVIEEKEKNLKKSFFDISFNEKDHDFFLIKHKKKKNKNKDKEIELSGTMTLGLCKLLAGALCFVIPHPAAYTIGSVFAASGLKDITQELKAKDKENKLREEREGPPSPPPHFPPDFFDK